MSACGHQRGRKRLKHHLGKKAPYAMGETFAFDKIVAFIYHVVQKDNRNI
jgi:hypothetical protein